jgi:hypothetical protein
MSKASAVLVRLTLDTGILDTQNTRRALAQVQNAYQDRLDQIQR